MARRRRAGADRPGSVGFCGAGAPFAAPFHRRCTARRFAGVLTCEAHPRSSRSKLAPGALDGWRRLKRSSSSRRIASAPADWAGDRLGAFVRRPAGMRERGGPASRAGVSGGQAMFVSLENPIGHLAKPSSVRHRRGSGRRGREAEGTRLLNEQTPKRVSRVRIPPSPPTTSIKALIFNLKITLRYHSSPSISPNSLKKAPALAGTIWALDRVRINSIAQGGAEKGRPPDDPEAQTCPSWGNRPASGE